MIYMMYIYIYTFMYIFTVIHSYHGGVKCNHMYPYWRQAECDVITHRRGDVNMGGTEIWRCWPWIGVMWPHTKKCGQPSLGGRGKEWIVSLENLVRAQDYRYLDFGLQNYKDFYMFIAEHLISALSLNNTYCIDVLNFIYLFTY